MTPSKRAFATYKPRGLFSEFYGIQKGKVLFFYFLFIFFFIILFPQQVLTYIVVVHIVILKSQKSHTRYLISSQGILHFTKQLKNVEMFRVCN